MATAFLAAGATSPPAAEDESGLRAELSKALTDTQTQLERGDDDELAQALRSVARAASRLARALESER